MNIVRYIVVVYLILLICSPIHAQIDSNPNTSTSIPAVKNDSGNSGISISPIENNGFSKPNSGKINGLSVPNNSTLNTDKKQFSMFGEEFGNPGELYEKQVNKHLRYAENDPRSAQGGSTTTQYLGDFKTKADRVNIIYRDHMYPDGDRVRIFVNDDIVQSNVLLQSTFSGFKLPLVKGFNKIDFQALNQGESGPNTAELQILDDSGNVIASSQWNLATGVKATLIVVKE
ncbi:hypothetical protein SAMN04487989_102273 [Bizionia echini]|uniref:Secreted protein n=1 Tax=Bizionia echini TaxID=649333 RepID=A0A1I5ATG4_9FLAO|nr:hypothetical protein [Bizionia echini]MBP93541.1 hypothetical protein [Flavobacteriaceae bacterium]SFN65721.1 hypothetical protein SAMN04487989_102273 [Bizionia echini]